MARRPFTALFVALVVATAARAPRAAARSRCGTNTPGRRTGLPARKVECGSLSVPLDYAHPKGPHITLALARLPARTGKKIGVLFTNPGGPGGSGVDFLRATPSVFPAEILESFDIVSWDPRGVGASSPVQVPRQSRRVLRRRSRPSTAGRGREERRRVAHVRSPRARRTAARSSRICRPRTACATSTRSARPIGETADLRTSASRTARCSARSTPIVSHPRARDGARRPGRSRSLVRGQHASTRRRASTRISSRSSRSAGPSSTCGFARGSDPAAAYDDLAATIAEEPIPGTVDGEHARSDRASSTSASRARCTRAPTVTPSLSSALAKAAGGDGSRDARPVRRVHRSADGREVLERDGRPLRDRLHRHARRRRPSPTVQQSRACRRGVAPRFGATTVWLGLPCTLWPVAGSRQGRADPRAGRAADHGRRRVARPRDAVHVGARRWRRSSTPAIC